MCVLCEKEGGFVWCRVFLFFLYFCVLKCVILSIKRVKWSTFVFEKVVFLHDEKLYVFLIFCDERF